MSGRVLNFSEFFDKYSKDGGQAKTLDDFTTSASNFEEGFDKDTYDQNPIGPNRPVSGELGATPPQPDEMGAPDFSNEPGDEMNAPKEMEETPTSETEEIEKEDEEDEDKEEDKEEIEKEEDEEDKEETPEPEAGANPKKEKVEESFTALKGFTQFVYESWHTAEYVPDEDWKEQSGEEHYHEDMDGDDYCDYCGEKIEYTDEGATCGCNM